MENLNTQNKNSIDVDPVLVSRILAPEERRELLEKASGTKGGDVVVLENGTRLYRLEGENSMGNPCVPETQQAVALMLKGIANVADVVTVESPTHEKYYFSCELELDSITANENPYALGAQQILLDTLFGDTDHHVVMSGGKPSDDIDMNVRTSGDMKKFYFFDFAIAFDEAFLTGRTYSRPYMESRMQWVEQSEQSRDEFLRLLGAVRGRFEGRDGLGFVRSVVQKVGVPMRKLFAYYPLTKYEALVHHGGFERHFRNEILRRTQAMEAYLEKHMTGAH